MKPDVAVEALSILAKKPWKARCALRDGRKLCALGVLGEVLVRRGQASWEGDRLVVPGAGILGYSGVGFIPVAGLELLGMTDDEQTELSGISDETDGWGKVREEIQKSLPTS